MAQNQIAKGALISYVAIFLNIVITFFYTPWIITQIGISDYGLYSLIGSFLTYFVVDFGLSGSITRYLAKYRAEGENKKIQNMLGLTMKVYLVIDTFIILVLTVCYFFLKEIFTGLTVDEVEKLKVLYIIAGTFSVLTFAFRPMDGAMMAFEYFVKNKVLDMVQKFATIFLIIIILMINGGVYELVFITGFVGFIVSLIKYHVFRRLSGVKPNIRYFDYMEMKMLCIFSMWVFVLGIAQQFRLTMMPTVLGVMSNSTEISIFALGMTIEAMVYTVSSALNGLFLPKVTRMVRNSKDRREVSELMIRVGRLQLFIIMLILSGFWLIGDSFINLWVGTGFRNTYYVVLCLTATNIISLTQHIAVDVVYAENKVKIIATFSIITSSLCLALSFVLSPIYGSIGCAIAFIIAMSTNLVLTNLFYRYSLNLQIGHFFQECHLKILPTLFLILFVFIGIKSSVVIDNWSSLFLLGSAYVAIYMIVSYFILFNEEERNFLQNIVLKKTYEK